MVVTTPAWRLQYFPRHLRPGLRLFGRWSHTFTFPVPQWELRAPGFRTTRSLRPGACLLLLLLLRFLPDIIPLLCSEITVRRRTASQGNPVRRNGRLDSIRANLCQMLRPRKQAGLPRGTSWSPPSRSTIAGLLSARIGTRSLWLWRGQDSRVSRSVPESAAGCCSCSYLTQ